MQELENNNSNNNTSAIDTFGDSAESCVSIVSRGYNRVVGV
jgi:hypothetical protein